MPFSSIDLSQSAQVLSLALRGIRQKRGLKTAQVAERMGMPQRTYELFETGGGKITFERLMNFAEATDCDPFALMLAGPFASPEFAIDCADTKLAMIMVMSLQHFVEDRGRDIAYLEPPNIIGACQRLFKDLGAKLDEAEAFLTKWLNGGSGMLDMGKLSLRGLRRRKA